MVLPTAQTHDQIVSLQRTWWLQYLIEFAKLVEKVRRLSWRPKPFILDHCGYCFFAIANPLMQFAFRIHGIVVSVALSFFAPSSGCAHIDNR